MKVIYAEVRHFGSYEHLQFNFQDQGLTLIAGPTGAGKSTLCDIIPWTLFGITAKNGLADDVRAWNATEPTEGLLIVEVTDGHPIHITRVRGPKVNDLYFEDAGVIRRGKDLADTQRLINQTLGFDANLYLSGAYFHEFSQAASFFTSTAKVRRVVTEQLVDLSLAKSLAEKVASARKAAKSKGAEIVDLRRETSIRLDHVKMRLAADRKCAADWDAAQQRRIAQEQQASIEFDQVKARELASLKRQEQSFQQDLAKTMTRYENDIAELRKTLDEDVTTGLKLLSAQVAALTSEHCSECGALKNGVDRLNLARQQHDFTMRASTQANNRRAIVNIEKTMAREAAKPNPFQPQIEAVQARTNQHHQRIESLKIEINPLLATVVKTKADLEYTMEDYSALSEMHSEWMEESADLALLAQTLESFRTAVVSTAIQDLESKTNALLTDHFDAELRVSFNAADADKLEATITKDGNECSYSQLSKGQRQLLKLCFGIAVMKVVSNHNAVKFDALFFDEFADGCDEDIKARSFRLLQNLAVHYGSVFAIDHSEGLKSMFTNRYDVELNNGKSQVQKI